MTFHFFAATSIESPFMQLEKNFPLILSIGGAVFRFRNTRGGASQCGFGLPSSFRFPRLPRAPVSRGLDVGRLECSAQSGETSRDKFAFALLELMELLPCPARALELMGKLSNPYQSRESAVLAP
jgi:hypothetical protein